MNDQLVIHLRATIIRPHKVDSDAMCRYGIERSMIARAIEFTAECDRNPYRLLFDQQHEYDSAMTDPNRKDLRERQWKIMRLPDPGMNTESILELVQNSPGRTIENKYLLLRAIYAAARQRDFYKIVDMQEILTSPAKYNDRYLHSGASLVWIATLASFLYGGHSWYRVRNIPTAKAPTSYIPPIAARPMYVAA